MMTVIEKIFITQSPDPMSTVAHDIVECKCGRCGNRWRMPVRHEFFDWKMVADEYQRRYETICGRINELLRQADADGYEHPAKAELRAALLQLRAMVEAQLDADAKEFLRRIGFGKGEIEYP